MDPLSCGILARYPPREPPCYGIALSQQLRPQASRALCRRELVILTVGSPGQREWWCRSPGDVCLGSVSPERAQHCGKTDLLVHPPRTHLRAGSCSMAQPQQAQGEGHPRGPQPPTQWFGSPHPRRHPPPPPCCVGGVCAASSGWPGAAGLSCGGAGPGLSHHWQPGPVCPSPRGHCPRGSPLLAGAAPDCHCHSNLNSGMQLGCDWRPWGGVDQIVRSNGY